MKKAVKKVYFYLRNKGLYPPLYRCSFYILSKYLKPSLTEIFNREIKKGMTVVDIGANIGFYSILASKIVGKSGKVYSFEPEKKNFRRLVKNLKRNRCNNVIPLNMAVGEKPGEIKLFINPENPSDHYTYDRGEYHKSEIIKATSIDERVKDKIDFIKMDIQGFEGSALAGMKKTFRKNKHMKFITEFWPGGLKKAGSDPKSVIKLIEDAGFKIYDLDSNRSKKVSANWLIKEYTGKKQTDLFCVK